MTGKRKSNFLPERVSGALKSLTQRIIGACVCVVALWAVFAMLFYNPYLDGFGVSSTFGNQSIMGYLVGMVRYAVGVIPGLFLFLCFARWGIMQMLSAEDDVPPEYNLLRGFIALCMGAIGFGMIAPRSTYGGMFGALAAVDVVALNHYEFDHDSDPITPEKHVTIRIKSLDVEFNNLLYTSADIYLDKVGIKVTPTVRKPEYKPENSAVDAVTYTILADSEAYYDVPPNNEDKNHRNISADREKTMFFIPQEMDSTTDATLEKTDIKATVTGTFEKWYDEDGDGTLDTQIMKEYDEDGNLIDEDGKFSINNQIKFNRHLEESYRYNVRLTFTSAAVSITVLTAEKWVDVPIYHEFH